jgi:hypothetical protein
MRNSWSFSQYVEEIITLSEIAEIPGIEESRAALITEMWAKFPNECVAIGLTDGVKK